MQWMAEKGFGSDTSRLFAYFMKKVVNFALTAGKDAIVWQEAVENPWNELPVDSTIVQVWKWNEHLLLRSDNHSRHFNNGVDDSLSSSPLVSHPIHSRNTSISAINISNNGAMSSNVRNEEDRYWKQQLSIITKRYKALLSAPWYLNLAQPSQNTWEYYWKVDPLSFPGSAEQKDRVIGGEACVWGELVDETNSLQKTWPLAAAVSERLWHGPGPTDEATVDDARGRLEELRCRMLYYGLSAAPFMPGYC